MVKNKRFRKKCTNTTFYATALSHIECAEFIGLTLSGKINEKLDDIYFYWLKSTGNYKKMHGGMAPRKRKLESYRKQGSGKTTYLKACVEAFNDINIQTECYDFPNLKQWN